ncbi:MAG: hypothetical protein IPK10_18820 [Bacteroidetes bacterium]|nr:hypothetical protein [Bacteroidota bacterium]
MKSLLSLSSCTLGCRGIKIFFCGLLYKVITLLFFILILGTSSSKSAPRSVLNNTKKAAVKAEKSLLAFSKDIQATAMINPVSGDVVSTLANFIPRASFTNVGTLTQTSIQVRYRIVNSSFIVVYDQIEFIATLPPGASVIVDFPITNLSAVDVYTIQAISELPLDENVSNDGIQGTISVMDPLCGTYTIGNAQPFPFNSISNATARLNAVGISCSVVFELEDVLYASSESFPIVINEILGAGPSATFTLQPKAGVQPVISGNSSLGIIRLYSADYVTINGSNTGMSGVQNQDLTILNFTTASNSAIISINSLGIGQGASNNTIQHVRLIGTSTLTTTGTLFGIFSGGSGIFLTSNGDDNDNNTFFNNRISNVQYGIYSAGGSATNRNNNTLISGNLMNDDIPSYITAAGIFCRYETTPVIIGNKIRVIRHDGTNGFTGSAVGIALGVIPSGTSTVFTGDNVIGAQVVGNAIDAVTQLHPNGYSTFGVVINKVTSGNFFVKHNMINGVLSNSQHDDFSAGIFYGGGSNGYIDFNTVSMNGNRLNAQSPSFAFAYGDGNPKVYLRNNILQNIQTAADTGKMFSIGTNSFSFSNFVSGPNNLNVGATASFIARSSGLVATGIDQLTLANWQSLTSQDLSSFTQLPIFVSSSDLHLTFANTAWNNTGIHLGAEVDFDNETRCNPPDIGADEFGWEQYMLLGSLILCPGESVTLTMSGGSTYLWGTGETTPSVTYYYAGNYSVVVDGCYTLDPIVVSTGVAPTATIIPSGPTTFCAGETVSLTASGGTSYLWSNGETSASITTGVAGTYTVTVTETACTSSQNVLVTVTGSSYIEPNLNLQKCLGGSEGDFAKKIVKTSDGGFVMVGSSRSSDFDVTGNYGLFDVWVVKTDFYGNIQWQRNFGGSGDDAGNCIIQTLDGGYLIAGKTNSTDGDITSAYGAIDMWVVKLNAAGILLWQNSFGGSSFDEANSILENTDGTVYVLGRTSSSDGQISTPLGFSDIWLVKLSSSGTLLWEKTYGGSGSDIGEKIIRASDNNCFIYGETNSSDGNVTGVHGVLTDIWIFKINNVGAIVWQKVLGGTSTEYAMDANRTSDGGLILTGLTRSNDGDVSGNHGNEDVWVVKLNSMGIMDWQNCYGGSSWDNGEGIIQTSDGGYLVNCLANSNDGQVGLNLGYADTWVLKLDGSGFIQWSKILGGSTYGGDSGIDLIENSNGSYTLLNSSASNDGDVIGHKGLADFWLVNLSNATISPSGSVTICDGVPLVLTASTGSSYLWSTGETTQSIIAPAGLYSVIVNGCFHSDTVTVEIGIAPVVTFNPPSPANLCGGSALEITVSGGIEYLWSTGATSSSIVTTSSGTFSVTVSNAECSINENYTVVDQPIPYAGFYTFISELCLEDIPIDLIPYTTGGAFTGAGVTGNTFDPAMAGLGTHRIVYTLSNGICTDSSVVYLDVKQEGDASFTILDPIVCLNESPIDLNPTNQAGMFYGPGVFGSTFDPAFAGVGGPYSITHIVYPTSAQWSMQNTLASGFYNGVFSSMKIVEGHPAVVYNNNSGSGSSPLYCRALDSLGTTWGVPVGIDAPTFGGFCTRLHIVDGFPAVVYTEGNTGITTFKFCRALDAFGNTWGTPIVLASGAQNALGPYDACSFQLVNGIPAVSYCLASGVYYVQANSPDGSSWGSPQLVGVIPGMVRSLDLIVTNNNPGIVYNIPVASTFEMYYTYAMGSAWSVPAFIDFTDDRYISGAVAHNKPSVAYVGNTGQLWYKQAADVLGSNWLGSTMHLHTTPLSSYYQFRLENIRNKPSILYAVKPQFPIGVGNIELYFDESIDEDGNNWGASEWVSSWNTSQPDQAYFRPSILEVMGKPAVTYYQEELEELKYLRLGMGTCGAMLSQEISVAEPPDASFGGLLPEYCLGDPSSTLTPETAGGVFNGNGMSGSVFSPGTAGYHEISYTVDDNGCASTSSHYTMVLPNSDAGFSGLPANGCVGQGPILLTPNNPLATFSGTGVSGSSFDPSLLSAGTYTVQCDAPAMLGNWSSSIIPAAGLKGYSSDMEIVQGHPSAVSRNVSGYLSFIRALDLEGISWGTPVLLNNFSSVEPNIIMVNNHPAVFYCSSNGGNVELYYQRALDPLGASWGIPQLLLTGTPDPFPVSSLSDCKAFVLDGRPFVLFDIGDGLTTMHAYDEDGNWWGLPYLLHTGNHDNIDLSIINGQPVAAFMHRTGYLNGGLCELFYQRATDYISNLWQAPSSLATNIHPTPGLSLQLVEGNPAVAFLDQNNDIAYLRASDDLGSIWPLPNVLLPMLDANSFLDLQIVNGKPTLAAAHYDFYSGVFHAQLSYFTSTDLYGNMWNSPMPIESWINGGYTHPDVSLSIVQGMPAILYNDAVSDNLKYTRLNPSTCASSTTQDITINPPSSFTITNSGSNPFCTGTSLILTAQSGTNYLWSNSETTQSISVYSDGEYSVKVDECALSDTLHLESSYCTQMINLKLFIEGFYIGSGLMSAVIDPINFPLICDSVTVELVDSADYSVVGMVKDVIQTNGTGAFNFSGLLPMHRYYVVVKHRNSIETWSKYSFLFRDPSKSIDFSNY